jgi:hypothetical protein
LLGQWTAAQPCAQLLRSDHDQALQLVDRFRAADQNRLSPAANGNDSGGLCQVQHGQAGGEYTEQGPQRALGQVRLQPGARLDRVRPRAIIV